MRSADWLHTYELTARAIWDSRGESPDVLAVRTVRMLESFDAVIAGNGEWEVVGSGESINARSSLGNLIAESVERDADNVAFPEDGYNVAFTSEGEAGHLHINMSVGASAVGRRMPSNSIMVTIFGPATAGGRLPQTESFVSSILRGLVVAWEPESAAVYTLEAARAARGRGRFAPLIGQRLWISDKLGQISATDPRVRALAADRGTYISPDDDLETQDAVDVVKAMFDLSDIGAVGGIQ